MSINWLSLGQAKVMLSDEDFKGLSDKGSLTARVREACAGEFTLELISHEKVPAHKQEAALLGLPPLSAVVSRQVFLCCKSKPQIFARTIMGIVPENARLIDRIASLGEQSLGSILFSDPLAVKTQMHLVSLKVNHPFFQSAILGKRKENEKVWLRRSLFVYEGSYLIVYEAFLRDLMILRDFCVNR